MSAWRPFPCALVVVILAIVATMLGSAQPTSSAAAKYNRVIERIPEIPPGMPPEQVKEKALEWYRAQAAKLVPEQKPIAFYGKVVDENARPVGGAKIHFIWADAASPTGTARADTASRADGIFWLLDVTGSAVSVYVSKDGYYEAKSRNRIDFDPSGNGSTQENPVLFHFRRKGPGTDLITSKHGVNEYVGVRAPRDGTPVVLDFFNRKTGNSGQLVVSNVKPPDGRVRSDWSITLSVPDGGLLEHHDEFPFEAPSAGYQPVVELRFDKSSTNWVADLKKGYYIAFGEPRRYGHIRIETDTFITGARLEYAINPDGSRYLEPK